MRSASFKTSRPSSLDTFTTSWLALGVAFVWGFAEATFFFLVPDVFLTLLACRQLRAALKASLSSLAGALAGGVLMFLVGRSWPEAARSFLDCVPGIDSAVMASVAFQLDQHGLTAIMLGPLKGIPYKIYAVEWGARGDSLSVLMLISVPARYVRFLVSSLATNGIARLIRPWTHHRSSVEVSLLTLFWIGFYIFYFAQFGL